MKLLAVDPGPEESGVAVLDAQAWPPKVELAERSATLLRVCELAASTHIDHVVCEWIVPYQKKGKGGVLGATTLHTARVVGWVEAHASAAGHGYDLITRPQIGRILCPYGGSGTPSGAQVAEAIREIYHEAGLADGGGSDPVRGTKAKPGPLYGMALSGHEGSALAVGMAWLMRNRLHRLEAEVAKAAG